VYNSGTSKTGLRNGFANPITVIRKGHRNDFETRSVTLSFKSSGLHGHSMYTDNVCQLFMISFLHLLQCLHIVMSVFTVLYHSSSTRK